MKKNKNKKTVPEEQLEEHSSGYLNESTMDFSDRYKVREDFIFTRKTELVLTDSLLHFNTMVANETRDAIFVKNFDSSKHLRIRSLAAARRFVSLLRCQIGLLTGLCKLVNRVKAGETIKDAPLKELIEYLLQHQQEGHKPIKRMSKSAVRQKFDKAMLRKYDEYVQEYKYYLEENRDETV